MESYMKNLEKILTAILLITIITLCLVWYDYKLIIILFLVLWFQNIENSIKK